MRFLNDIHMNRYEEMIQEDNTYPKDIERQALFYILSGNSDLYTKKNHIYDFEDHSIKLDCLNNETVDFSSSSKALIRLGFNLYNGYTDNHTSPCNLFYSLDEDNYNLAINGTDIRFGMAMNDEIALPEEDELDAEM
ncbi:MAG: DUF6075 family protein [Alkaliphilus sp.]